MLPTFVDGSVLLTISIPRPLYRAGQAVVLRVPGGGFIVKRIADMPKPDSLRLGSDNPNAASIYCGNSVPVSSVIGLVVFALPPVSVRRTLRNRADRRSHTL